MVGDVKSVGALLLLGAAAFCGFGLAATYEPMDDPLPWRIGYGAGAFVCAAAALRVLRGRSSADSI